jgi:uncharacterized protein YbjT (DUF2867 family)
VAALRESGVQVVEGDLRDPHSLERACQRVTAVISTATAIRSQQAGDSLEETDMLGQIGLVDAARAAGVRRFVYVSATGAIGTDNALGAAKRAVEERLHVSGMEYTILRPTCFMEVWLGPALGFDPGAASAVIYGGGENAVSWISQDDVAAFATDAVDNPAARNAVFELGGPEALTPRQAVQIFEEEGGRTFQLQVVPEEALQAQFEAAADPLQKVFAALTLVVARGDVIPMAETLRVFPVTLRSVRDYARAVLPPSAQTTPASGT